MCRYLSLQVDVPKLYECMTSLVAERPALDGREEQHSYVAAHVTTYQDAVLVLVSVEMVVHCADLM